jgi:hypothetical protein
VVLYRLCLAVFRTVMKTSRYSRSPNRDVNMVHSSQKIEVPYSAFRNALAVTQSEWLPGFFLRKFQRKKDRRTTAA